MAILEVVDVEVRGTGERREKWWVQITAGRYEYLLGLLLLFNSMLYVLLPVRLTTFLAASSKLSYAYSPGSWLSAIYSISIIFGPY